MAQLAAVPEHGKRLRETQSTRIQPTHPSQHPPRDSLVPPETSNPAGSTSASSTSSSSIARNSSVT